MTGIRPSAVWGFEPWLISSPGLEGVVPLQQHFRAHGYHTIGSGKIYHTNYSVFGPWDNYKTWGVKADAGGPEIPRSFPGDPRPPKAELPLNGILEKADFDDKRTKNFDWGPVDASDEDMGDWKVADWAISQLKIVRGRPFFLACGFVRPHLPWYVPKKYFNLYPPAEIELPNIHVNDSNTRVHDSNIHVNEPRNDLDDVPCAGRSLIKVWEYHDKVVKHNQWEKAVQGYLASMSFADTCVGRVIEALNQSQYSRNTIIVLWSDNGFHLGEKLHWRKFALWEESTHVPLMFVMPREWESREQQWRGRCGAPVNLIDIYPTLVDLCQLPPVEFPQEISSGGMSLKPLSLKPLLENPSSSWDRPSLTTWRKGDKYSHALRTERWRYIRYWDDTEELYDHRHDQLEWTNLARNIRWDSLKQELARWFPKSDGKHASCA